MICVECRCTFREWKWNVHYPSNQETFWPAVVCGGILHPNRSILLNIVIFIFDRALRYRTSLCSLSFLFTRSKNSENGITWRSKHGQNVPMTFLNPWPAVVGTRGHGSSMVCMCTCVCVCVNGCRRWPHCVVEHHSKLLGSFHGCVIHLFYYYISYWLSLSVKNHVWTEKTIGKTAI